MELRNREVLVFPSYTRCLQMKFIFLLTHASLGVIVMGFTLYKMIK